MSKKEAITLAYPIEVDGIETDTLYLRRCLVKDIKAMDGVQGDMAKSIHLVSALCNVPPETVENMDASDFVKLTEQVAGFLPSGGMNYGL